jgi:hypothetical protein
MASRGGATTLLSGLQPTKASASNMIASTCLALLFVPSFFAVLQRFEERRKAAKVAPLAL